MKICILYGGCSKEREVSLSTGRAIFDSINTQHDVFLYDFDGKYDLLQKKISDVDLVFNALHGGDGENGVIQKFLEDKNIKFTGSDSVSSKKAMDKNITKLLCLKNNILTPDWLMVQKEEKKDSFYLKIEEFIKNNNYKGIVLKPNNEGSSVGISIIKKINFIKIKQLLSDAIKKVLEVSESVLVEEYINGRELTVSILNGKVLPIVEIIPKGDYYNYDCKYTKFQSDYIVPAKIDKDLAEKLSSYSLKIHQLIGCGVYSRLDFRLSEDKKIYFLEINTLPGFTDTSLFPKSALEAKMNYNKLINKIINLTT